MPTEPNIALYALLFTLFSGLATLAAWVGAQGQKIKDQERRLAIEEGQRATHNAALITLTQAVADMARRTGDLEAHNTLDTGMAVQIGVLTERVDQMKKGQDKLDLHMVGVQRSLANMVAKGRTDLHTFDQEESDR